MSAQQLSSQSLVNQHGEIHVCEGEGSGSRVIFKAQCCRMQPEPDVTFCLCVVIRSPLAPQLHPQISGLDLWVYFTAKLMNRSVAGDQEAEAEKVRQWLKGCRCHCHKGQLQQNGLTTPLEREQSWKRENQHIQRLKTLWSFTGFVFLSFGKFKLLSFRATLFSMCMLVLFNYWWGPVGS